MSKYMKIDKEEVKFNKNIKEYLNPDYIYIPYPNNSKLNVKSNELVDKNSIILINNDNFIYSPVSGKVLGMCENLVNNKKMNTIVIENDFKETTKNNITKNINNYTSEEFKELVNKYLNIKINKSKYLVINGIDYEPYEMNYTYLIKEESEKILECIDSIINILKLDSAYLSIKNNDEESSLILVNQIGMYPNINLKLLDDVYPIGYYKLLINELNLDLNDCLYLTIEDVYNIYYILRKNSPINDKIITISGNLINKSKVIKVKMGTLLSDIINEEFKIISDDYHIIVNGLLSGKEIPNLKLVINKDIRSIFINKALNDKENKCINCGLCHINCPFNCDPLNNINMNKCIKCGLCNYICPSKIKLVGDKS